METNSSHKSIFIIDISYKADLSDVDKHLTDHIEFLDRNYENNIFLCSGAKKPRTGGIILASATSRESIERLIQDDPFKKYDLADFVITEFVAKKTNLNLFESL